MTDALSMTVDFRSWLVTRRLNQDYLFSFVWLISVSCTDIDYSTWSTKWQVVYHRVQVIGLERHRVPLFLPFGGWIHIFPPSSRFLSFSLVPSKYVSIFVHSHGRGEFLFTLIISWRAGKEIPRRKTILFPEQNLQCHHSYVASLDSIKVNSTSN